MKIIAGRAKSGKTSLIYDQIIHELNSNDSSLILIVPELMTYKCESDLIEKYNLNGIMNIEIVSFKKLEKNILQEVEGFKLQEINLFGKIMLLRQVFEENKDKFQIFGGSAAQKGFLLEIEKILQELKQNLVHPISIQNACAQTSNEILKRKLHDIGMVYEKYNEKTQNQFFDEEDKTNLFAELIKKSKHIKNSKIWIDGFESFNYQRLQIIKNLEECSEHVTLSLNTDPSYFKNLESNEDWEAFKIINDTYNTLCKFIDSPIEIINMENNKINVDEIKAIEKNMFSLNVEKYWEPTDKINISTSLNPYKETEKIAAEIISLARDKGYRWKDIKIAIGSMDVYLPNIKKIFEQYEIPYFLDVKRDIMDNPLVKYLLSLLELFDSNFKHDKVFEFLKTGYTTLSINQTNVLENYALKHGIEGEKWFQPFEQYNKQNNDASENLEDQDQDSSTSFEAEEYRKIFTGDFKNRKEIKGLNNVKDITQVIFSYFEKHKIYETIEKSVSSFILKNHFEEASEFSQTWNYLMEIFQQLILVSENEKINIKGYLNLIEAGLREVQISIIPPTIDRVEIGDTDRIAVGMSKCLFVMGANQSNLDVRISENTIILNEERDNLLENNVKLTKGSLYNDFRAKHMLYKLFSSASERLYISYAMGSVTGEGLNPSMHVETIKRIFPLVKESSDLTNENQLDLVSNYSGTYDNFVENIRSFIDGFHIDGVWKDVYAYYEKDNNEIFNTIKEGFSFTNKINPIKEESVESIYRDNMTMTVSKLESYAQCRFKYFVESVLKPRKRSVQKIEFTDLGDIYHLFVERFIDQVSEYKDLESLEKDEAYKEAEQILNNIYEETKNKVSSLEANNRNRYMKEKISRVLKRTAWTLVRQLKSSEFRPRYTELIIDQTNENNKTYLQPIEIPVEMEGTTQVMKLRGKIDRVDVYENPADNKIYVTIIDYKSSYKDIDINDANEGLQIQLLIYLKTLRDKSQELFGKGAEIGGVFYYHFDDPIIKGDESVNVEDLIFKELKLRGYVLRDLDIVKKLDTNIGTYSDIIPAGITSKGELSYHTKSLSHEEFNQLIDNVFKKCIENTKSILQGNIDINPYKKENGYTPCSFCEYISICQFDKTLGNNYHLVVKTSESEGM